MRFTLYDFQTGGTVVAGPITKTGTDSVQVTSGLFTTTLDFGAGIFSGPDRWLNVEISPQNQNTWTAVGARQQLTPSPYAIAASNLVAGTGLAGIYSGAVTFNNAANSFTGNGSGLSSLNAGNISSGSLSDLRLSPNVALRAGGNSFTGNQTIMSGNVGIGTANPSSQLEVVNGDSKVALNRGVPGVLPGGTIGFSRPDGVGTYTSLLGVSAPSADDMVLFGGGGGTTMRLVSGEGSSGGFAFYENLDPATAFGGTVPPAPVMAIDLNSNLFIAGKVGIGATNPVAPLEIRSDGTAQIGLVSTNGGYGSGIVMQSLRGDAQNLGFINFLNGSGAQPGGITYKPDDTIHFRIASDDAVFLAKGGIAITTSAADVPYGGSIKFVSDQDFSSPVNLGSILFDNSAGTQPGSIRYVAGNDSMVFRVNRNDYLTIANDGTVIVPVLQINGADVAEPFALSTKDIPKGSVVIIDENSPGQLTLSDRAYDKRVAGILSGANGVHPGIRLKQEGFNDQGEEVALSGRVYALADASYGAIKPGDLLTTSDTPGHCMKVADHGKAQGAIIGKAMSSLKEGKGMVLVLVSLQ